MSAPGPSSNLDVNPIALLSGTVNEGNIGPAVGLLDIGVSDSAYLFRLALPGILKDPSMPFPSFNSFFWASREILFQQSQPYIVMCSVPYRVP